MIWLVVTVAAVCAAFVAVFAETADIWASANAAGALVLVFLVAATIRMTRPPVPGRTRAFVLGSIVLGLAGVSSHWLIIWSTTSFQYDNLLAIRRQIERGVFYAKMEERALPAFAAYYRQQGLRGKSLGTLFVEMNPGIDPTTNLLDTLGEGMKVYAVAVSDSEVVMRGESGYTAGRDREFRNRDGRTSLLQSRVRMTPAGVEYEIEN